MRANARRWSVVGLVGALVAGVLALGAGAPAGAALPCETSWADPGTDGVWDQTGVGNGIESQWVPSNVPTASDAVCLPAGDYTVTIAEGDGPAVAESLSIGAGVRVVIAPAGAPTDDDDVIVTVGGSVETAGRLEVGEGARLLAAEVTQTGGVTEVVGQVSTTGGFTLQAGRLSGADTGGHALGRVGNAVHNTGGVLDPGVGPAGSSAGYLYIGGPYTQGPGGTYHVDYDGTVEGEQFDHVHVFGAATLAGRLELDMTVLPQHPGANDLMTGSPDMTVDFDSVVGAPSEWVGAAGSFLKVQPAKLFDDVPVTHGFLLDIAWLVSTGVTTGFPDGTYKPTAPVTRQSMAAFLYRFAGSPTFSPDATPEFSDVGTSHGFRKEIEWLVSQGVTEGFPDGTYRPTAPVTRQGMAVFLYRFAGSPAFSPDATPQFSDVGTSHGFRKEIEWLAQTGVTTGFPGGTFRPGDPVTRQSMAAFLHRFDRAGLAG